MMRSQWTISSLIVEWLNTRGSQSLDSLGAAGFFQRPFNQFIGWKAPVMLPRGRDIQHASFLDILWIVWKERNARSFEGEWSCNCWMLNWNVQVYCGLVDGGRLFHVFVISASPKSFSIGGRWLSRQTGIGDGFPFSTFVALPAGGFRIDAIMEAE